MRYSIRNQQLYIDQFEENTDLIAQIKSVFSMKLIQPLINQGKVWFNHQLLKTSCMVKSSADQVVIPLVQPEIPYGINHEKLNVLYEDELFFIVSKPKGIIIYDPVNLTNPNTLVAMIHGYYQTHGIGGGIYYLHRLDKDTSGIVVCVKHQLFVGMISQLFADQHIHRQYHALVSGMVKPKHQVIEKPIGKNRHLNNRYLIAKDGKYAKTVIDVIEYGCYHHQPVSLVKATLYTGRTHQIRVHLSSISHPIINDAFYGQTMDQSGLKLHASSISFKHPLTNNQLSIDDTTINLWD